MHEQNSIFNGEIPASKSILNRLLVMQSFFPEISIRGDSKADDVVKMKGAIAALARGEPADCGAAGTTFRFLALRASRLKGRSVLTGSKRLFERPQTEILHLLERLGVRAEIQAESLVIDSGGWQNIAELKVDRSISSQFASAVVLSAWQLEKPLRLIFDGSAVSEGYLQMTLQLVARGGMRLKMIEHGLEIPAHGTADKNSFEFKAEPDISSAFAVAALAVTAGRQAHFTNWPLKSLQPDIVFVSVLEQMGCRLTLGHEQLTVHGTEKALRAIDFDLGDSPDLFPVLSVLCGLAEGTSNLHGAPHLAHKESSRIHKSAEILKLMGVAYEIQGDGMRIHGRGRTVLSGEQTLAYDPEHDHRLAMAAAVAQAAGFPIKILNPSVVGKSFPEFWTIAERTRA